MLAVSTYTEPVVNPIAVNDLPQINEHEEKSDKPEISKEGSFAELLAGLLRNTENNQEIPVIDVSGHESEQLEDAEKITLLKEMPFPADVIEPSDTKVSIEDMNVLAGIQNSFYDLETIAAESAEGEFYRELSNLIRADLAPEADLDADFFDINAKTALNKNQLLDIAAQTAQSAIGQDEALAENNVKKDRSLTSAQKASIISENIDALAENNERVEEAEKIAMLRARPENQKLGKLDEMRNNQRNNRNKVAFEVTDMRTGSLDAANNRTGSFAAIETSVARAGGEPAVREITLELRLPEQNNILNQVNTSWEAKSSGALENLLARELHQSFNGDIVRHASMALKDGGEGTIKIALKPESLGNVKIALELADNKITGKILVESEEALNAFRKEIASLEQAFKDSGFAAADLNLSLTSNGQNAEGWEDNQLVPRFFASRYEDNTERMEAESAVNLVNVFIGHRKSSINMLA